MGGWGGYATARGELDVGFVISEFLHRENGRETLPASRGVPPIASRARHERRGPKRKGFERL